MTDVAAGKDAQLEAQLRHIFPKLWDEDARCNAPRVVAYMHDWLALHTLVLVDVFDGA